SQAVSPGSTFTGLINIRVSNPSGIAITGTLPVNNGATFTAAANGTAVTSGTVTYGTTTILAYVTALGAQTCGNEFPASSGPVSLTINNTNATTPNVSLSGSRTVTGTLTITAGRILLGNNDLTLANGGVQTITTPGATKMIVTDGTGLYKRGIPATTGTYLFPIGETTGTIQYSPVSLQFTANSTIRVVGARVVDAVSGNMNTPSAPTDYLSRYWTFSENGAGGTYNYYINPALAITGAEDEVGTASSITAAYWDGSGWVPSAGTYTAGSLTSTNTGVSETAAPLGVVEWTGRVAKPVITLNSFLVTSTAISGTISQCSATGRDISVNVIPSAGTLSSVNITYNNGSAVGPVAMTNTSGSTYTYTIPAASPTNTNVTWSITATNSLGSSATYTGATYQDNPNVGITATATATPSSICAGASTSLSTLISKSGNATIGTGTGTNSASSAVSAWFGTWYGNGHAQILILASELTAAGLKAGNLTGLNIPITTTGSPTTLNNYTIKIGATSATAITTFQAPTFTTVWGPTNYTPSTGTNSFTFTTSFNWNGTSNIIIDYCYANSVTGSSSAVNTYTTTAFGSFVNYNADGAAGAGACGTTTVSNTSSNRPNFVLVGNTPPTPSAYTWSDGSGTVGTTNPLSQSPTTNTSYTCTAIVNGCPVVSTTVPVTVTTVAPPTAVISSSSQCGSAIPTVSVTPSGSGVAGDLRWYDASSGGTLLQTGGTTYSTAIASNTTFYVAQVSGSCESTTRTALTVTVSSPDALTASSTTTSICFGSGTYDLSVAQTGSTNTYGLTWTASPVSGSGIGALGVAGSLSTPNTITPTAPGTYIYTITGVDGTCTATNTVTVTVNAPPAITTNPTSPSTASCLTTSASLTAAASSATSYQWQSSSTLGGTYTDVVNGTPTGASYTGAASTTLNISTLNTTYFYRMVASRAGCTDAVSTAATVTVNNPTITGTTPATRCGPGTVTLSANGSAGTTLRWFSALTGGTILSVGTIGAATASFTTPSISTTTNYFVSAYLPSPGTAVVGAGATATGNNYSNPLYSDWSNQKQQVLILASELQNAGLVEGNITNLSLNLVTTNTTTRTGFTIKLAHTASTALTTTFLTPSFTQVYTGNYTPAVGTNSFAFGTGSGSSGSFNWDGTSNLLMEICWDNLASTATINSSATADNTAYNSVLSLNRTSTTGTSICGSTATGTTYTVRPRYTFTGQTACSSSPRTQVTATVNTAPAITATGTTSICAGAGTPLGVTSPNDPNYTYTWMPGSLSGASQSVSPGSTQIYTVTAVDASGGSFDGCTNTGTVTVTVNNVPAASITPTPANSATGVCYAGSSPVTSVSWAATAGATSYDVYFGSGSLPGTVTANVTTNSWTITPALAASTTYFWSVVAKNACGDAVGSATWSFTTAALPCYCAAAAGGTSFEHLGDITIGSITLTNGGHVTYRDNPLTVFTGDTATTASYTVTNPGTWYTGDALYIFVDWNQDGDFVDAGELVATNTGDTGPYTGSFTIPSTATIGTTRIRFKFGDTGASTAMTNSPCQTGFTYGEVEDARFNVTAPTGCTGTPTGGTVTVTPSEGAPASTYAVAASGYTAAINITYLWQSNTNGAGWVDIGTASSTYASLTGLTAPAFGTVIQYRLLVTCTTSSQSAYSSTGTFTSGYCTPSGSNGSYWITNFTTTTGITNINNTSAAGVGGYSNFTAQSCSQYQGSAINLSISTNTSTHYFYVWVDWNNDGDFVDAGEDIVTSTTTFLSSYSGSYTIPLTQAAGSFRMRVGQNWSATILTPCGAATYGEYEDYIFTVVALPACSGTPSAGTVVYSGGTLCANVGSATITNSGFTTGFSGLTYQWLSSNDNFATDTSSVSGGSNPASLSTGALTATTSYLVRAFCSNSGIYSYSNKITVPVNAPAISTTVPASRCDAGTLTISATGTSGSTIRWYTAATGGTLLQTGTAGSGTDAYTTVSLPYTSNNTYYVEALNGTCTSIPRTPVTANVDPPTTNPTISPSPTITICRDSILTLNASGSTVSTTTLLYEGFESTTFLPSTFNVPSPNGDGDYFQSSSYYFEGSKAIGLYSETDYWDWLFLYGIGGNVNLVQATPMNLSSYLDAKLTFYHICATEDGYDFGLVQYNDGSGWQNFPASAYTGSATLADANGNSSITDQIAFDKASYSDWDATFTDDLYDYLDISATGYDPGNSSTLWKRESIDLTPFMTNNFRVRFRYTFDDITDYYGWLIDSIAITGNQVIKYAWSPNTGLFTNAAATTAYDSLTTPNAATVYAKPTATTTYKAIAYTGPAPATCSGNASVTVNVTQKPTATINAARPYLCDATAQLSVSALTPPTATINWTNASGTGSASATGSPATVSGLAGTTVYNVKATDGVCVDVPLGTSTVVTPSIDNSSIATSPSAGVSVCNYCVYQDGNTKTYYNSTDGKIIASITDETSSSASLGETEICFKALSGPGSVTDNIGYTQPYLGRVWTIHPAAGSKALITLYFTDAELAALQAAANSGPYQFSGYYSLSLTKYPNGGSTFTPDYSAPAATGGTGVSGNFSSFNTTDHQVQFAVDDFSTFYIHPVLYPFAALPVELVSFTGWNAGEKNELEWKTASELNTLKFIVEKKIDGGSFTYLGELPAAGNSSQLRTYNYSDLNPVVGNNYYRLKIIDIDGKFSYSNIINVPLSEVLTNNFVSVYPNPTGGELNVGIQSTAAYDTKVLVYDIIGTKMFEQSKGLIKGLNTVQFDFSSFAKGAYILHFTDNNGKTHTTKFVKE
ncbi:MAG: T9SS type A sorting domain-containing protein, partial [Chitinophagales bacterium]|nr:T9SS type A sorting domain-containing protein [Chitinophagales bacterium]